jgi:hypothetical protein
MHHPPLEGEPTHVPLSNQRRHVACRIALRRGVTCLDSRQVPGRPGLGRSRCRRRPRWQFVGQHRTSGRQGIGLSPPPPRCCRAEAAHPNTFALKTESYRRYSRGNVDSIPSASACGNACMIRSRSSRSLMTTTTRRHAKPCVTANPASRPTLRHGQPCVTANPASRPTLRHGQPCVTANPASRSTHGPALRCDQLLARSRVAVLPRALRQRQHAFPRLHPRRRSDVRRNAPLMRPDLLL